MIHINDILLLVDGRIAQVIMYCGPMINIQYMDKDESSCVDPTELDVEYNMGSGKDVSFNFYSNRSIHIRLNKLNNI